MNQQAFINWKGDRLRRVLSDARITIDHQRRKDIEYLRQMVSNNFFDAQQAGYNAEKSSVDIRMMHERYINNADTLLNMTHALIHTLRMLKDDLTQCHESMLRTDEWQSDCIETLHILLKELQQHDCAVMLIGDTGAGKCNSAIWVESFYCASKGRLFIYLRSCRKFHRLQRHIDLSSCATKN